MRTKTNPALLMAALTLALTPAAAAATSVTVRIEGAHKTLLQTTTVKLPGGKVTKSGGSCSANSAAGALDAATHHRWAGTFDSKFGDFSVTGILGESHSFTSTAFWEVLVDNVASNSGICGTKVHRGSHVVFAAIPISGTAYPLVLHGPAQARVGATVTVTVDEYVGAKVKPAAGVKVAGGGLHLVSDRHGHVKVHVAKSGALVLHADGKGFIRAAPLAITELP